MWRVFGMVDKKLKKTYSLFVTHLPPLPPAPHTHTQLFVDCLLKALGVGLKKAPPVFEIYNGKIEDLNHFQVIKELLSFKNQLCNHCNQSPQSNLTVQLTGQGLS